MRELSQNSPVRFARATGCTLRTEIDDVNVGSHAAVISEIVPWIIGVLVNRDRIAGPVPIHYIGPVHGNNLEVITVKPESFTVAAFDMKYMTRSEPEPKLTVGKWVVDVGNVLMLYPLFPLDVRPGSRDRTLL